MSDSDRQRFQPRPVIVAHSGCMETPANSLDSITAAARSGADAIEFDVQATRDGVPVLMHDETVHTVAGVPVKVATLDVEDLRPGAVRFSAAAPPDLETVCRICHHENLTLNLDVKDPRAIPRMLEIVTRVGSPDTTFVTGCHLHAGGGVLPVSPLAGLVNIDALPSVDEAEHVLDRITRQGWMGINVEHVELTAAFVRAAHRRGLRVGTWTVDTPAEIRRVISLGCDYITSNYPDRVRHVYDHSRRTKRTMEDM